jgi:hypothetical protein
MRESENKSRLAARESITQHLGMSVFFTPRDSTKNLLVARAVKAVEAWQKHRQLDTSLMSGLTDLESVPAWMPRRFVQMYNGIDPCYIRIIVLGKTVSRITNSEWPKHFLSWEEREALILKGLYPDIGAPLCSVVDPNDWAKACALFVSTIPHTTPSKSEDGMTEISINLNHIFTCINRESKPFAGLVRISHFVPCYGGILMQAITCARLPPQDTPPTVSSTPGVFERLASFARRWYQPMPAPPPAFVPQIPNPATLQDLDHQTRHFLDGFVLEPEDVDQLQ